MTHSASTNRTTESPRPARPAEGRRLRRRWGTWERRLQYMRILALAFCAAGFAAIVLGWMGTARVACVDCQVPYLLSGGAAGLGLLVFGATLLLMAQMRAEGRRLADRVERVGSRGDVLGDGHGGWSDSSVVAGRATYHRPECQLVKGKHGLDVTSLETARQNGLSPCRLCHPVEVDRARPAVEPSSP